MIKKILLLVLLAVVAFIGYALYNTFINPASPAKTAQYDNAGLKIDVAYNSPFVKGRKIFGSEAEDALQPHGEYWRLGANNATKITFNKNVKFGDLSLPAGSYSIYAVPGVDTWQIGVNKESDRFGFQEPDFSQDLGKITVPVATGQPLTESMEILFMDNPTRMLIDWENIEVAVPIIAQ